VKDHCYALVAYSTSSTSPFRVYNPWGTDANGNALGTYNGRTGLGLFNATAAFINSNFEKDSIASATPDGSRGSAEDDVLAAVAEARVASETHAMSMDELLMALAEAGNTAHSANGSLAL
jgi:hypothetical protein